jgi:hypothetical protein
MSVQVAIRQDVGEGVCLEEPGEFGKVNIPLRSINILNKSPGTYHKLREALVGKEGSGGGLRPDAARFVYSVDCRVGQDRKPMNRRRTNL